MATETFLDGRVVLRCGDCVEVMAQFAENSVDSVVTDPPYGLQFMGSEWDKLWRNSTDADVAYTERTRGDLTSRARKLPDYSASNPQQMQQWHEAWAREALRVLKPGGHLIAFGGTRTYHRLACAIEDAGFEIRDTIMWVYGSGFPKSHDVSKGIDRAAGAERQVVGIKTYGNGETRTRGVNSTHHEGYKRPWRESDPPTTDAARQWEGWGSALKPSCEPCVLARKPLGEATIAANVLRWGTGALNIDGCRVEAGADHAANCSRTFQSGIWKKSGEGANKITTEANMLGRWPANLIHDGSPEALAAFPESKSGETREPTGSRERQSDVHMTDGNGGYGDSGSAARFFASFPSADCAKRLWYGSKADHDDRLGALHPTVKPVDLMRYLVRLVTPPGGTVLDMFAGTGTTGEAAFYEGMRAVLIEREAEYCADIRRRMALVMAGPDERARESIKAKNLPRDDGPLFGGTELQGGHVRKACGEFGHDVSGKRYEKRGD